MKDYSILDSAGKIPENICYGFDYGESELVVASFDPWTGKWLKSGYTSGYLGILYSEFAGKEEGNEDKIRERVFQRYEDRRSEHKLSNICDGMDELINGEDKGMTRTSYLSQIRSYIFYPKGREDFEAMDYCPFCGAKLPDRLDNKLTEILQKEYGLESWKDYKKAPKEFHTDEWWRKRGL